MSTSKWLLSAAVVAVLACDKPSPTDISTIGTSQEPAMTFAPVYFGSGNNNETFLAINPTNDKQIAVSWQQPVRVSISNNGGQTWQLAWQAPQRTDHFTSDPLVAYDPDGGLYAIYLDFERPRDARELGRGARANGIYVQKSADGGVTWNLLPTPVIQHLDTDPGLFEDKPAVATARNGIHVAWTQFSSTASKIMYARSDDRGASFRAAKVISDRPGTSSDSTGAAEGTDVAVGPDGTIYVVWSDAQGIWLDSSKDGGNTWGSDVLVSSAKDMFFRVAYVARANGFPTIDVDPRSGRVYVVWVQEMNFRYVPLISHSENRGATWSAPAKVVENLSSPSDRFFASVAVDPTTGVVGVGYYVTQLLGYYSFALATSVDGGNVFTERRWQAPLVSPSGDFIGDYVGVAALNGSVHAAWTGAIFDPSKNSTATAIWMGTASFNRENK